MATSSQYTTSGYSTIMTENYTSSDSLTTATEVMYRELESFREESAIVLDRDGIAESLYNFWNGNRRSVIKKRRGQLTDHIDDYYEWAINS